jgi:hypothetical protein
MPARTCGISRFVLWRSDRDCWWFRRAVPGELVGIIGKREWRQTLNARSRADAEREAIPLTRRDKPDNRSRSRWELAPYIRR